MEHVIGALADSECRERLRFRALLELRDELFPFIPAELLTETLQSHRSDPEPVAVAAIMQEALKAFESGRRV